MRTNGMVAKARAVREAAIEVQKSEYDALVGEPHDSAGTMEHACARRATHRGYCAESLSHNGAWALTSYQRGLAWVGRKPGWVQRAHVTPYTRQIVSRDTVSEAPAPPPCLGLVGEEATFTSAGLYPRHFPRPGSTNTSSSARPICFHRWREDVLPQEFPSSRPLSPVPPPLEGPSSVACDVPHPLL